MYLPKLSAAMDSAFFEGLNLTNDQHPQNSRNLRTSRKTNNMVIHEVPRDTLVRLARPSVYCCLSSCLVADKISVTLVENKDGFLRCKKAWP